VSLVTAEIATDFIEFNGDSRFTTEDKPSDVFSGGLKIIILNKHLCIAYAGDVKTGEEAIRLAVKAKTLKEIISILLPSTIKPDSNSDSDCEFIIGWSEPSSRQLVKIKEGKSESYEKGVTWIGNIDAYEVYQKAYHEYQMPLATPGIPTHLSEIGRLRNAMDTVLKDEEIINVGDSHITAQDDGRGFMYMPNFTSQTYGAKLLSGTHPLAATLGPGGDSLLIEVKTPEERGVGAIGIYVHEAQRGALYAPLLQEKPFKFDAVDPEAFRLAVFKATTIKLMGGGFIGKQFDRSMLALDSYCTCGSGQLYKECHYGFDRA
jgi:hypothetical protein